MIRISEHFIRHEFSCKCGCGFNTVDVELINLLEQVRKYFDKPVTINSGCRCGEHNTVIGGSLKSQHVIGRAADIVVKDTKPADVAEFLETINAPGIGRYNTFTHVDSRYERNARWSG